jgi:hypothetical protein
VLTTTATRSTGAPRAYADAEIALAVDATLEPWAVGIIRSQPAPAPSRATNSPARTILASILVVTIPACLFVPAKYVGGCTVCERVTATHTTTVAVGKLSLFLLLLHTCKVGDKRRIAEPGMLSAVAHSTLFNSLRNI